MSAAVKWSDATTPQLPVFTLEQEAECRKAFANKKDCAFKVILSNGYKAIFTKKNNNTNTGMTIPSKLHLSELQQRQQNALKESLKTCIERVETVYSQFVGIIDSWQKNKNASQVNVTVFQELAKLATILEKHNIIVSPINDLIQDIENFLTQAAIFTESQKVADSVPSQSAASASASAASTSSAANATSSHDNKMQNIDTAIKEFEKNMKELSVTMQSCKEKKPKIKKSTKKSTENHISTLKKINSSLQEFLVKVKHINAPPRTIFNIEHPIYKKIPIRVGNFPTKNAVEVRNWMVFTHDAYVEFNDFLVKVLGGTNTFN